MMSVLKICNIKHSHILNSQNHFHRTREVINHLCLYSRSPYKALFWKLYINLQNQLRKRHCFVIVTIMVAPICLPLCFVLFIVKNKGPTCFLLTLLPGSDWGADLPNGNDNSSKKSKNLWKKTQEFPSDKAGPYPAPNSLSSMMPYLETHRWKLLKGRSMSANAGYLQKDYSVTLSLHIFGFFFKSRCTEKSSRHTAVKLAIYDYWQCFLVLDSQNFNQLQALYLIYVWFLIDSCASVALANFKAKVKTILLSLCSVSNISQVLRAVMGEKS